MATLAHGRREEHQARLQDAVQPFWTWLKGGCHPNRDTIASVEATGFVIEDRHVDGTFRRFAARPQPGDANRSSTVVRTEKIGRSEGWTSSC